MDHRTHMVEFQLNMVPNAVVPNDLAISHMVDFYGKCRQIMANIPYMDPMGMVQ